VVNFRLLPGDTVEEVEAHVARVLAGLPVQVQRLQHSEATPVAATGGPVFRMLQRTIQDITPDTVFVAPYLVPGATDARHYADLSDHVFRFLPFRLTEADRSRIHGRDERIARADYAAIVAFYQRLIRNADALPEAPTEAPTEAPAEAPADAPAADSGSPR
jgi:carboxypeptidase PM20D1